VPVFAHLGTVMFTEPDGVGTFTLLPRTASLSEIGRSTWMSSPLRVNVQHRAAGERDLPLAPVDRVEEIELQSIVRIRAAHAYVGAFLPAENL